MGAGTINAAVGSGTLITFPTLLAFGVPPVVANVSNTIGLVPGSLAGAWGYRRELAGQRGRIVRLGVAALIGGAVGAEPPPPSTPPPASVVDTVVTSSAPTTDAPPTAVRRGGTASGSIAKPEDEQWSVRRMVTTVGLCVVALAAAGYAYGRIRSTPPRHPGLVRSPD